MKTMFLRLTTSVLFVATTANAMQHDADKKALLHKAQQIATCNLTSFSQLNKQPQAVTYIPLVAQFKKPVDTKAPQFATRDFPKDLITIVISYCGTSDDLYQSIKDLVLLRRVNKTLYSLLTDDKIIRHVKNYKEVIETDYEIIERNPFNNNKLMLAALEKLEPSHQMDIRHIAPKEKFFKALFNALDDQRRMEILILAYNNFGTMKAPEVEVYMVESFSKIVLRSNYSLESFLQYWADRDSYLRTNILQIRSGLMVFLENSLTQAQLTSINEGGDPVRIALGDAIINSGKFGTEIERLYNQDTQRKLLKRIGIYCILLLGGITAYHLA